MSLVQLKQPLWEQDTPECFARDITKNPPSLRVVVDENCLREATLKEPVNVELP